MKRSLKILLILVCFMALTPFQYVYGDTLEEQLNNLVGPKKQYNTMLSPVYLKKNLTEEYISSRSGDLTLTQTDYVLPGRNNLDLEIKRIYKSGVSNVQEMKVKYQRGAWVDYVHSDAKTSSFYEDRYNIGIGMRFSFPQMEIRKNSDESSHMFLHTESGDTYRLKRPVLMDEKITYLLEGQTIKDVYVRESTDFSNGQSDGTSKYVMMGKDGKKTYFAEDGRLLGIVDRYGNTIKFECTTLIYTIDGTTITKKLISKITDTVGRVVTIEYKEDHSFKVGAIVNNQYSKEESYKASQNPNTEDSGDLKGKFQTIVHLPGNKKIVYDKTAVLVSKSKNVIRTRLQRVFDVDNKPKYHYWYEQPSLGFTYTNGTDYSVYNRYENLVQVDYCKTNRMKRYTYNTYAKELNTGSMQYRKIFEKKEIIKRDYDTSKEEFLDKFVLDVKDKVNYTYNNEPDGFGYEGYEKYDDEYLENTYRYNVQNTDEKGNAIKYTYDGLHQLINTEKKGKDHKEIITTEHDEMKLIKKKERQIYNVVNGAETGSSIKKIENYRYDEYGNLTNYTGVEAKRDENGYPIDTENTVVYSYAYDKYHVPTSKTWKKDMDTTSQIIYDVDDKGNILKETNINTDAEDKSIKTEYQYDTYGNMTRKEKYDSSGRYITNYEYGIDADGVDRKGAYLTMQYTYVNGVESAKEYAYDFNTGNMKSEIDPNGNRTNYTYDILSRVVQVTRPDATTKRYSYDEKAYANMKIKYIDPDEVEFLYEYDIYGDLVKSSVLDKDEWNVLEEIEYDSDGSKTKEIDANGHSIRYEYDSKNRLVKKSYYENDTVSKGNMELEYTVGLDTDTSLLVSITDEEGYIKKFFYDIQNRLIKSEVTPDNQNYYTSTYTYDYEGNKLTTTDAKNNTSKYIYDNLGRLIKKIDPINNETVYSYNALGKILTIKEPGNKITEYIYDEKGRVKTKKMYKEGTNAYTYTKYTYDSSDNVINQIEGKVVSGVDNVSSDTTYVYDQMNRLTDKYGRIDGTRRDHINYSYDNNGNKIKVLEYEDEAEDNYILYSYDYDFRGKVKTEDGVYKKLDEQGVYTDEGHYLKKYERDYAGNLVKEEVFNGSSFDITTYEYDYRNNLIKKTEPYTNGGAVKTTSYKYDKKGNLLSQSITRKGVESTLSYTYDGLGRSTSKIDPLGNTTRYVYDENNNLIKEVDPRYLHLPLDTAPRIQYEYDSLNRKVKTIVFDGSKEEVIQYREYDGRGNLIKEADGEGYNSENSSLSIGKIYEYDAIDNITRYISAQTMADNLRNGTNNHTKKYSYDGAGQILSEEDALDNKIQNSYYLNGKLKERTYPDGEKESYDYDLTGKLFVEKTDKTGNKTRVYNTIFKKPYRKEYPDGTYETFEYSEKGELTKSYDREGNEISYKYDPSGNPTEKREYIKEDVSFYYYKITKNTYDEGNAVISIETFEDRVPKIIGQSAVSISAGNKVEYIYDKAGRLIQVLGPKGRETVNEYDKKGNLITIKKKISGTDYDIKRYEYDIKSQLIGESILVKTSDIETKYLVHAKYDKIYFDRVLSTTGYTYYSNGQIESKKDPQGNITKYEYDYDKRLTKKIDTEEAATVHNYDLRGNLIETINAKGISNYYEYDSLNRLTHKKTPTADDKQAVTRYIYDTMGNLIKEISPNNYVKSKDNSSVAETMRGIGYTYDNMNRRISTLSPDEEIMEYIDYDKNGNVRKIADGLRYTGDISASLGTRYVYDGLGRVISITNALGDSTYYDYDILGNLTKERDTRNNETKYEYSSDSTLERVIFADGSAIEYTYDYLGRKTSIKDQRGNITAFVYNGFGKEKEITDPYDNTLEFKYDLNSNLVKSKDKNGSTTELYYDSNNRLSEKKVPLEKDGSRNTIYRVESFIYDEVGNITRKSVKDSKKLFTGREINYTYYDNNLVKTETDSSGAYIKRYYDKTGNLIKAETLRDTGIYDIERFEYDDQNRLTRSIKLVDEEDIFEAGDFDNIHSLRDDEYSEKIRIITGYEYDILGNRIKQISPRAFEYQSGNSNRDKYTISFTYDVLNRPEKIIRKHSGRDVYLQYYYDEAGNKIKERNERGYETSYTYDTVNRLETITDSKGSIIVYSYDLAGNKVSETNAKGNSMTYSYDKLGRLETIKDPYDKVITRNIYDSNGNVIEQIDAKGYRTQYEYDLAGRVIEIIDPEAAQLGGSRFTVKYEYNPFGDRVEETNGLGDTTVYSYDGGGRLLEVIDALGVSTSYTYDKAGNKLTMLDGRGKITSYSYGAFGMLVKVTNPENKEIAYKYDIVGNVANIVDKNGNNILYTYDDRNLLLTQEVVETNDIIEYDYDAVGNRIRMEDESGTTIYSYDENNWLEEITKDGQDYISYTYDEIGNIETVTDKKGFTVEYSYDKSSRMETVDYDGNTTTYSYDDNGNRKSITYDGGVKEEYSYDKNNRLLRLTNRKPNGSIISSYSYTYDLAGRQITKTDSYGTTDYTYDEAGRVLKIEAPGKTTIYIYDKAGNRQSQTETYTSVQPSGYIDQITQTQVQYKQKKSEYIYSSANMLLKLVEKMYDEEGTEVIEKTTSYLYDNNGNELRQMASYILPHNMTMKQSTGGSLHGEGVEGSINTLIEKVENTFDGFNRLKKVDRVKDGERSIVTYLYNGDGLRTRKEVHKSSEGYAKKVTNYYYDRQHVTLEINEAGNIKARYVRGINYIARYGESDDLSYYLYNGHGDVVQTVSEAGQTLNQYDYDIFGNPTLTVETYENAIRYAGEFYDEETGLYYLRARYYNPYTGRFISEDSYWGEDANPLSLNLYTYAYNNPIMYVDPSGHSSERIDEIIKEIDEQKKKWMEDDDKRDKSKGKAGWTENQRDAHEKANDLRDELARLEKGNKDVEELRRIKGGTNLNDDEKYKGQWEKYKLDRTVDKAIEEEFAFGFATETTKYKIAYQSADLIIAQRTGQNSIFGIEVEVENVQSVKEEIRTASEKLASELIKGLDEVGKEHGAKLSWAEKQNVHMIDMLALSQVVERPEVTFESVIENFGEGFTAAFTSKIELMKQIADYSKKHFKNPISSTKQSFEKLSTAWQGGIDTSEQIIDYIIMDIVGGDANTRAKFAGRTAGEIVIAVATSKVIDSATRVVKRRMASGVEGIDNLRFSVDPVMHSADEAAGVLKNGVYSKNPTAQNLADIVTDTGKIGSKKMSGKYMYVVDMDGNVIIGTRAGQRMPHPTLVGGANPQVQAAGIVDIRGGKIYSIDNASGHFKPSTESLNSAQQAFENISTDFFHKDFQGYIPFE